MVGLTTLEAYSSIFIMNTTSNKIKLYKDTFDGFSFAELKHELAEIPNISDIIPYHL